MFGGVVLALNLMFLVWLFVNRRLVTGEPPATYLGLFLSNLLSSATPVFTAPGQIGTYMAAARLPPLQVGLVSGLGAAAGELPAYFLGYGGQLTLPPGAQAVIERFRRGRLYSASLRWSFVVLLIFAAIPNPFLDPLSVTAGLSRAPLRKYLFPVALGKVIRSVGIALLGHAAASR